MKRVLALLLLIPTAVHAADIQIGTFNTQSDSDTQPFNVAEVMRAAGHVGIWALQEVSDTEAAKEYTVAASSQGGWGASFRYVVSESGQNNSMDRKHDLLAIVYESSKFRHVETVELHGIRSGPGSGRLGEADWGLRGALFLRLQHYDTGVEFYVGNVHLKCCGDGKDIRAHQAEVLKHWVDRAEVPVILVGDFNIPVDPDTANGNQESVAFVTLEESMTWHRPVNPVSTQCNPRYNSMLDHVFAKGGPNISVQEVTIQQTQPEFCEKDPHGYPDHRPVIASVVIEP